MGNLGVRELPCFIVKHSDLIWQFFPNKMGFQALKACQFEMPGTNSQKPFYCILDLLCPIFQVLDSGVILFSRVLLWVHLAMIQDTFLMLKGLSLKDLTHSQYSFVMVKSGSVPSLVTQQLYDLITYLRLLIFVLLIKLLILTLPNYCQDQIITRSKTCQFSFSASCPSQMMTFFFFK